MDTLTRFRQMLAKLLRIPLAEVAPDMRIVDDLGAKSVDIIEIAMWVEDEFDLEMDDPLIELNERTTVRELAENIDRCRRN